ncbi:hypothetical protein AB4332_03945 [Vibrio breoganii]
MFLLKTNVVKFQHLFLLSSKKQGWPLNYLYAVALIISAIGMLVSVRYLIGDKPLKDTAMVFLARGTIKVLVGVGCGLVLGIVLAVVDVVIEQAEERAALSFMLIGFFFGLSMLISVLFYKVTLNKVFDISVSWLKLAKSIGLEFTLIASLSFICILVWQLLV